MGRANRKPCPTEHPSLLKISDLLVCLDAFGNHFDVQMPRDGDDGADDGQIAGISHQIADEAAVDLECINPPILEITQA